MTAERIVIVGGARCGKSTLARSLRAKGYQTFCGDPIEFVKDPERDVIYLPSGLDYAGDGGAADWIAHNWFEMSGPWVCEGHVTARALERWLRRWVDDDPEQFPCDRIIVFLEQHPSVELLPGQRSQHKGTMTVWNRIAPYFTGMYEERRWSDN
jgi:hypothetical protein